MSVLLVIVAVILGVAAITGLIFWGIHLDKKKQARFQKLADSNGWRFERKPGPVHQDFDGAQPFGQGHSRTSTYLIEGKHGSLPFRCFRYQYTTGSGKEQQTHVYRIFAAALPLKAPARLTLQRENVFHKIFDALGGEDIDFESDEFSRRFWVRCDDRRFAYDVVSPAMMEYLLEAAKGMWTWIDDKLVYAELGGLKVDQVVEMLDRVEGFAKRVPRHLLVR